MKVPARVGRMFVAVLLLGFAAVALRGEDLGAVKSRMEHRATLLKDLKAKAEVGEDNRGFVVLRGRDPETGDVVAAENHDRRLVYAEGARDAGASVEQVGRFWARKFAAESAKGAWLQKEDGTWYQK
jgi:uncharacterized protein YdbL (DUF1318 family)